MSGDMVKAVQGWRWMPGQPMVRQSFIVRVPESVLDAELERQCLATRALPGWLPTPTIVEVPAEVDTVDGGQLSDYDLARLLWWTAHQMKRAYRDAGFSMANLFCRARGIDPDAAEYDVVHSGWTPS